MGGILLGLPPRPWTFLLLGYPMFIIIFSVNILIMYKWLSLAKPTRDTGFVYCANLPSDEVHSGSYEQHPPYERRLPQSCRTEPLNLYFHRHEEFRLQLYECRYNAPDIVEDSDINF
jgi:hypothetical protein